MQVFDSNKNTKVIGPKVDSQVKQIRSNARLLKKRRILRAVLFGVCILLIGFGSLFIYLYIEEIKVFIKNRTDLHVIDVDGGYQREIDVYMKSAPFIQRLPLFFEPEKLVLHMATNNLIIDKVIVDKKDYQTYHLRSVKKKVAVYVKSEKNISGYLSDGTLLFVIPEKDLDGVFAKDKFIINHARTFLDSDIVLGLIDYSVEMSRLSQSFVVEKISLLPLSESGQKFAVHINMRTNIGTNFVVMVDLAGGANSFLDRFYAIWDNLSDKKRQELSYIDMRFEGRVYVCLINNICSE